jgi:hypothetical protein
MVRNVLAASALALAVTAAAADPAGPNRLIPLLPAESEVVFLIEDIPEFLVSWPSTPLGRTWNDPAVKRFLAPMRDDMELDRWEEIVREGTGYELSEILDSFTGPAAVVILSTKEMMESEEAGAEPPMLALAEIGGDGEILRELLAVDLESSQEEAEEGLQIEPAEEEFRGETLHFWREITADGETETNFWAIVDNIAVFAGSKDLLHRTVSGIKEDSGGASLESNQSFQSIRTRFSPYDVLLYLNVAEFVPALMESIREEERKQREAAGETAKPPNPLGITNEAVYEALGLDALHGVTFAYRLGEETSRIDLGITYDEAPGIVRIMEAYRPGPVELPQFIPDDVLDASISNFSFPMTWKAVREILQRMSPQLDGMMEMQLAQLKMNTGIDIEGSLLSSLGERFVDASFRKPAAGPGGGDTIGEPDQLFGIALADHQGLELVLELAKNMAGPFGFAFDEQEFLDQTIYVSKMPAAPPGMEGEDPAAGPATPPGFSYALTPDYLFISVGTSEPIRTVLSRMRQPGRSIWARPEVQVALEAFSDTASGISYMDFASLIMQIFEGFVAVDQFGELEEKEAIGDICNPDALPDQKVLEKYLGLAVGAIFREKGGLYMTTRVHAAGK